MASPVAPQFALAMRTVYDALEATQALDPSDVSH
jgi:hypothetical protein